MTAPDTSLTAMLIYGTRPEAIKMAPLVRAMRDDDRFRPIVVVTGQHREMLDQVNDFFGITPDVDLDIHAPGQSLTQVTTRTLTGVGEQIEALSPDVILAQGDTTSAFAAGLAAFYHEVPVAHVEAGLRTGSIASPFPEEANRRLLGQITSLHLCPTGRSRDNLLREAFDPTTILVTGNTVIDALLDAVTRPVPPSDPALAGRPGHCAPAGVVGRADGAHRACHRASGAESPGHPLRPAGSSQPACARGAPAEYRRL